MLKTVGPRRELWTMLKIAGPGWKFEQCSRTKSDQDFQCRELRYECSDILNVSRRRKERKVRWLILLNLFLWQTIDSFFWCACKGILCFIWFHRIVLSCNCAFTLFFCLFVMLGVSGITLVLFCNASNGNTYSFTSDWLKFLLWWVTLN